MEQQNEIQKAIAVIIGTLLIALTLFNIITNGLTDF